MALCFSSKRFFSVAAPSTSFISNLRISGLNLNRNNITEDETLAFRRKKTRKRMKKRERDQKEKRNYSRLREKIFEN